MMTFRLNDDEDPEEDLEEYPSEEHEPEDDNEDPEDEHEPEDFDETEPLQEDETTVTPPPPRHHRAKISVRPQTPMTASTHALIDAVVESSAGAARAPRSQYNFVDTVEAGHGLASEQRMMTSIEEVNLRNRALLARLETLETHMSCMEWQRQSAEDLAVTQMMRIHTLEARAHTDTVEDSDSSC
nr:hypothetical protein [Tanacetum cinerariifolium]